MLNYNLREKAIEAFEAGKRTKLLTRSNVKIDKSKKKNYLTTGIHLSPANMVSKKNLCPFASKGCLESCLNTSGQGALHLLRKGGEQIVQDSRALRTIWYERDREGFMNALRHELKLFVAKAERKGMIPAIRLNLTSDILWERTTILEEFKSVQFYDYRKVPNFDELPDNYHITFSKSESNDIDVRKAINAGLNIAVVFDELPETYLGLPVINGDETDLRFLDPSQVIVGLKAKGQAKGDNSGFVVKTSHTLIDRLAA